MSRALFLVLSVLIATGGIGCQDDDADLHKLREVALELDPNMKFKSSGDKYEFYVDEVATITVSLSQMRLRCRQGKQQCDDFIDAARQTWLGIISKKKHVADPKRLSFMVKPTQWVDDSNAEARRNALLEHRGVTDSDLLLAEPWIDGLSLVYAEEHEGIRAFLHRDAPGKFGLDLPAIRRAVEENLAAAPPTNFVRTEDGDVLLVAEPQVWTSSSSFAVPKLRAAIVRAAGGRLIVGLCSRDHVYAVTGAQHVEVLREMVDKQFEDDPYHISTHLYEVTVDGVKPTKF